MAGHTPWAKIRERTRAHPRYEELAAAADAELKAWRMEYKRRMEELRAGLLPTQSELLARLEADGRAAADAAPSDDPRVSALREYIEALGGELEIVADFGDERISLTSLEIDERKDEAVAA
jgi:hypothetical protein